MTKTLKRPTCQVTVDTSLTTKSISPTPEQLRSTSSISRSVDYPGPSHGVRASTATRTDNSRNIDQCTTRTASRRRNHLHRDYYRDTCERNNGNADDKRDLQSRSWTQTLGTS